MQEACCRVTVIIALYNSAGTLDRAVRSALGQTLNDVEIIIVDDASRDHSLPLARELAADHPCIRVIALPENRGKAHAVNLATGLARGEWIAVLDADDWYEPERLSIMTETGDVQRVDLVADNQRFWDGGAHVMVQTAFAAGMQCSALSEEAFVAGSDPYSDFDFGMLKPIIRQDFIRRTNLRYRENARLSEDFLYLVDFFTRGGKAVLLGRPMYNWTQSFGKISRQWTLTGAGAWRYDYESALRAYADAYDELRKAQKDRLSSLLTRRMRAFRRLGRLSKVNQLRASGAGLTEIVRQVVGHPSIWPLLSARVLRFMMKDHGSASGVRATRRSIDNTAT